MFHGDLKDLAATLVMLSRQIIAERPASAIAGRGQTW